MNESDNSGARIESYVLGTMSMEEAAGFERDMAASPELTTQTTEVRRFHEALVLLGRAARISEAALEEKILTELPMAANTRDIRPATILHFRWLLTTAIAASIAVLLFYFNRPPAGPLRWQQARVVASATRSDGGETGVGMARLTEQICGLQQAISGGYAILRPGVRQTEWTLHIDARLELQGSIVVRVTATRADDRKEWDKTFESAEALDAERARWAQEIANELAAPGSQRGKSGGTKQ